MGKPRYVPPQFDARLSPEAAAALEPEVPLPADLDRRLAEPAGAERLRLCLAGLPLELETEPKLAALLRRRLAHFVAEEGELAPVRVSIASCERFEFETQITRFRVEPDGELLRVGNRGLVLRADPAGRRVRVLIEHAHPEQELGNLLRVLLYLFARGPERALLHSAAIERDGRVDLFLGRSTAGKSTLARLSADRNVVSDDAVLLHWHAGTVWAVSVGLWGRTSLAAEPRPGRWPVRGLFALRKGARAELRPLSVARATLELSALVPRLLRDPARDMQLLELAERVARALPRFELVFARDDPGFWQLIEATLTGARPD